ncbi:Type II toxin-antitoxin system HigB family toxin [Rhodovastum atsumiense]|uniref:Type II toxin-antitoxin system HigB family toxin n=1 Tax=Rhodovastum atsumiense TaxID=504468 RepID=A0A5M6J1W9_9PROT|nr:type II toxin-antitoxin system HigB family toxin [Rhodovastum atsumiense]KAA5614603.1 type II toxin-antitoxin system HigB family toxin [Rhodovastum atsumiense]CAH2599900.1 Type II toxin-antitoxin system HigB family toxin [Rhodovastum atsumiense]
MQVIARRLLTQFWGRHRQATGPLRAWYAMVSKASWQGPADVKVLFRFADFAPADRIIFAIDGNRYRVVARVSYRLGSVFVIFVGTRAEYDALDPGTV